MVMSCESHPPPDSSRQAAPVPGAGERDLVRAALDLLRGIPPAGGEAPGSPTVARQKENLREWARRLGLLLDPEAIVPRLGRGGQEHDIYTEGERVIKVTRNGIFGLSPGIELALVSSGEDARRFQLWEATPLEYLERLDLHNQLVPGLNVLEGVFVQADGDMAIVTSQPRFDIVPVSEAEIENFAALKNVQDQVLRDIARNPKYKKKYTIIRNLANNPRTPLDLSLPLMNHLMVMDLKNLSMNKNVPETLRKIALKRFKEKSGPPGQQKG